MRLGIGSYTYTWAVGVPGSKPTAALNAFDLLEKAAELGVRVAQFADNLPLDRLSPCDVTRLSTRARDLGIEIEAGTRGITPEHLRRYLDLAMRLGSKIVRVVVDTAEHRPDEDDVVSLIREVLPEYEDSRVTLAIENHDRFSAREFARIVEHLDSPNIGICLDTVNSFGALEGPDVVVETLAAHTVNLHVKDFTIRRANHQMGFAIEGLPAGEGRLDVARLLERLRGAGRDPNAILELWTPPAGSLDETIAREDAWARQSVNYLRGLIPD